MLLGTVTQTQMDLITRGEPYEVKISRTVLKGSSRYNTDQQGRLLFNQVIKEFL